MSQPRPEPTDLQAERRLIIPASIGMVTILGPRDEFLRVLERDLRADIHVRGNEVRLAGTAHDVVLAFSRFGASPISALGRIGAASTRSISTTSHSRPT